VDLSLRMATGRERAEVLSSLAIENGLGHDRAGRISGAEKENAEYTPVHAIGHGYFLCWLRLDAGGEQAAARSVSERLQISGCPSQQSLIRKAISARMPSTSAR
jgi:hypothetical protein